MCTVGNCLFRYSISNLSCTFGSSLQIAFFQKLLKTSGRRGYCILRIGCAIFVHDFLPIRNIWQDLRKIILLPPMRNICANLRKIVLLSLMYNICATFAQDLYFFPNAQYLHKIVLLSTMRNIYARLYFFPLCAIYAQYWLKIVLLSPMQNICARLQALLEEICHISHTCSKFGMVLIS